MAENFRRQPIRSRRYLDGSRGQPCTLQITGCCTGDVETTVAAHIRDETTGGAIKADDISIADACFACHRKFDGHDHAPLTSEEWHYYALRGLQRTLRNRVERGLAVIAQDRQTPAHEAPIKPRKPRADRAKINSNPKIPAGRKLVSANNLSKRERQPNG